MERIIKFRAWDDTQKYMAYQGTPDLETIQSFIYHFGNKSLMQFTGLEDMNGKEIYEGDIICDVKYQTWNHRGIIKFSHGVFGAEWLPTQKKLSLIGAWGQKHHLRKLDDDILECKIVIGNIFENPKLFLKENV
jgi:uncharacterized phage protein (TIGR01671 family)